MTEPTAVVDAEVIDERAVARRDALREMVQVLMNETALSVEEERGSTDDFVMDIVESILSAESEEEIFEAQEAGTTSGKDFINIPFRLLEENLTFLRTAEQYRTPGTLPFYVRMDCARLDNGEWATITTGGNSVVAVLYALRKNAILERYNDQGGRPLVIVAKQGAVNEYLLLKPYAVAQPKASKSAKRTS